MQQFIIRLSEQERTALLQIVDIANKAKGLEVSETCVVLARLIMGAEVVDLPDPTPQVPETTTPKGEKASK